MGKVALITIKPSCGMQGCKEGEVIYLADMLRYLEGAEMRREKARNQRRGRSRRGHDMEGAGNEHFIREFT